MKSKNKQKVLLKKNTLKKDNAIYIICTNSNIY